MKMRKVSGPILLVTGFQIKSNSPNKYLLILGLHK